MMLAWLLQTAAVRTLLTLHPQMAGLQTARHLGRQNAAEATLGGFLPCHARLS